MSEYVKEIITDENELDGRCEEIDPKKQGQLMREIILSLKETMRKNNLVSLSAPQIGYKYRIFCVRFGASDYRTFINPVMSNIQGF